MRAMTPFDFFLPALQATRIFWESQMVIALRLSGMAGVWRMPADETSRMVSEKISAGVAAAQGALGSGMAGNSLPQVAMAAMKPIRRKTRSNARRLHKGAVKAVMTP